MSMSKAERQALAAAKLGSDEAGSLKCYNCGVETTTTGAMPTGRSVQKLKKGTYLMCVRCANSFRAFKAKRARKGRTRPASKKPRGRGGETR